MSWGMNVVDVEKLKVGDEVGTSVSTGWTSNTTLSKVAKLTKTQIVLDDGKRFNKRGREVGGNSYHQAILLPVDEARERMREEHTRRVVMRAAKRLRDYKWDNLSAEQLKRVVDVVDRIEADNEISPDAAASQSNVETPVKHEEAPST